jgi:hypothetical protein
MLFMGVSCELVNLEPIGMRIEADGSGGALASAYSPVKIVFDCKMAQTETGNTVSVRSIQGNTDVDRIWEASTLLLTPVAGWSPGVVYTVSVSGVIYAVDGREERVAEHASFHYGSARDIPFVVSFYPPDGAKTGVSEQDGAFVQLFFSQSMDTHSVEDAFTINGFPDKECAWEYRWEYAWNYVWEYTWVYTWNEEKTIVTVTNSKNIAPLEKYEWTLDTAAKSAAGFPLAQKVSAQWTSDAETLKPTVSGVYPVKKKESEHGFDWVKTGNPIESGFGYGEAVQIEFSRNMDIASLKNIIRFEPSLAGRTEVISLKKLVFIPERNPVIGTYYTMTISGDAKDENGITMGDDYRARFKPDITYLDAVLMTVSGSPVRSGGEYEAVLDAVEPELAISVEFNQAFLSENQIDSLNQIKVSKVFPADAPTPVLTSAVWTKDKVLSQVWSKLADSGGHDHRHYYQCVIPGGQNGITNGKGAYLKEDLVFYISASFR